MNINDLNDNTEIALPGEGETAFDDAYSSLHSLLTDRRPLHSLYIVGDRISLDGRVSTVIAANPRTLCLKFDDTDQLRIIDRRAPNLEPARLEDWRNDTV